MKNSIRINEMISSQETASESCALIGVSKNSDGQVYIVRSIVNRFNNELDSIDTLYAINAKTQIEDIKKWNQPGDYPQGSRFDNRYLSDSTISIAQLLDFVNRYFPDILPVSVMKVMKKQIFYLRIGVLKKIQKSTFAFTESKMLMLLRANLM